jgi:hypothetical protein
VRLGEVEQGATSEKSQTAARPGGCGGAGGQSSAVMQDIRDYTTLAFTLAQQSLKPIS